MRAIFGLVGILITVGVIVWWMGSGGGLSYTQTVIKSGDKAREQVNQIGGMARDTGEHASDSAELQPLTSGGKLDGILVTAVTPGGAYDKYFGLKRDDTIVGVEYQGQRMNVKDMNDEEMAKAQVVEAYSRQGKVVVVRNDKQITLPEAPPPGKPVAQQGKGNGGSHDELQQQLDTIQQMPGAR